MNMARTEDVGGGKKGNGDKRGRRGVKSCEWRVESGDW